MNKIMPAVAVIGALWAGVAAAQTAAPAAQTPARADPCATGPCRKAVKDVIIRVDTQRYQTISVPASPYVLEATTLLLFPGETIAFQLSVEGDRITGAKLLERLSPTMAAALRIEEKVAANPEDASLRKAELSSLPANVLLLSYGQREGQPGMLLMAQHNLAKSIKVDAIIAIIGPNGYVQRPTSTCPMRPGIFLLEHWPDNLGPIILTKPRFLADGADLVCN